MVTIGYEEKKKKFVKQKKWALIIGISEYKHSGWNLKYADDDANDFYDFLLKSESVGIYSKDNIMKLVNDEATKTGIEAGFNFLRDSTPEDSVIIFFSCHGIRDPDPSLNEYYLITHNSEEEGKLHLPSHVINLDVLVTAIEACKANDILVFIDACHSGGIESADLSKLIASKSKKNIAILASSRDYEKSIEYRKENGHGVFTDYLLKGLHGNAETRNTPGIITVDELFDYIIKAVKTNTTEEQVPISIIQHQAHIPVAFIGKEITEKYIKLSEGIIALADHLNDNSRLDSALKFLGRIDKSDMKPNAEVLSLIGHVHMRQYLRNPDTIKVKESEKVQGNVDRKTENAYKEYLIKFQKNFNREINIAIEKFEKSLAHLDTVPKSEEEDFLTKLLFDLAICYLVKNQDQDTEKYKKLLSSLEKICDTPEKKAIDHFGKFLVERKKAHALLIGVEGLTGDTQTEVSADTDINNFKNFLIGQWGFEDNERFITICTNGTKKETLSEIKSAGLANREEPEYLLIYYSGNGYFFDDNNQKVEYFMDVIGSGDDITKKIQIEEFFASLSKRKAKNILLLLDTDPHSKLPEFIKKYDHISCISATSPGDITWVNDNGEGVFTKRFISNWESNKYNTVLDLIDGLRKSFVEKNDFYSSRMKPKAFGFLDLKLDLLCQDSDKIRETRKEKIINFYNYIFPHSLFGKTDIAILDNNFNDDIDLKEYRLPKHNENFGNALLYQKETVPELKYFDILPNDDPLKATKHFWAMLIKYFEKDRSDSIKNYVNKNINKVINELAKDEDKEWIKSIHKNLLEPKLYALIVGSNFQEISSGPQNDINNIKSFFKGNEIVPFDNKQATKTKILEEFTNLVSISENNPALFYFAGTGTHTSEGKPAIKVNEDEIITLEEFKNLVSDKSTNLFSIFDVGWVSKIKHPWDESLDESKTDNHRIFKGTRYYGNNISKGYDDDYFSDNEKHTNGDYRIGRYTLYNKSISNNNDEKIDQSFPIEFAEYSFPCADEDSNDANSDPSGPPKKCVQGILTYHLLSILRENISSNGKLNITLKMLLDKFNNKVGYFKPILLADSLDEFLFDNIVLYEKTTSFFNKITRLEKIYNFQKYSEDNIDIIQPNEKAEYYLNLGIAHMIQMNKKLALQNFEDAEEINNVNDDKEMEIIIDYYKGRLYYELAEYQNALSSLSIAFEKCRKIKKHPVKLNGAIYYFLGKVLKEDLGYPEKREMFEKYKELGYPLGGQAEIKKLIVENDPFNEFWGEDDFR